jgi:membrane protease YdiL (CAAX protease family)
MDRVSAYHASSQKGWRALSVLVALLIGCWTLWATVFLPILQPVTGWEHTARSIGVRLLFWVLPCGVYLWLRHGKQALSRLGLGPPRTLRQALFGANVTAVAAFAVSLDVGRKLEIPVSQVWARFTSNLEWAFPTPAVFEELIFRGVILSELLLLLGVGEIGMATPYRERAHAWLATLLASVVFVGLHWPWWIFTEGVGEPFLTKSIGVFLLSLVLGMQFFRTRSLWPCVLLHWLNNQLSALTG